MICLGASIGTGIGFNLQRALPEIQYGLFAVAGESPSASIFQAPIFFMIRKAFRKNGWDAESLKKAWHDYEITPERPPRATSPFVIVLGRQEKLSTTAVRCTFSTAGKQLVSPSRF